MKVQKPHRKGAKAAKVRKENFGFSLRSLRLCGEALLWMNVFVSSLCAIALRRCRG